MERPKVGIGVIIQNSKKEILLGKRKNSHSPFYSIPGGHLELGETFEEAAIKEVFEETGLLIYNPIVFCVTNNLRTYREEDKHYVSISLYTNEYVGILVAKEPDKCEEWNWYELSNLPAPQFDASEFTLQCFMEKQFYIGNQK